MVADPGIVTSDRHHRQIDRDLSGRKLSEILMVRRVAAKHNVSAVAGEEIRIDRGEQFRERDDVFQIAGLIGKATEKNDPVFFGDEIELPGNRDAVALG